MRLAILLILGAFGLAAQEDQQVSTPFPIGKEEISGSVDTGYRWISDVGGNFNTYRSVVDLGEGPKLFGADLLMKDPGRNLFDSFILNAHHWGGEPYNTARIDAQRDQSYRIVFDYRNLTYLNFLPSFANPKLGEGVLLNQRSFDTRRRLVNTELEIWPGSRIVPYLGYMRDSGSGTGITPFVTQGNEFPVSTNLDDKTDNFRGGVRFEMRRWHVTLEQGGTTFKDDQHVFTDAFNDGNRTTPILGRETFVEDLDQSYRVRGDSLYTRALLTAAPASWLDVSGQFLYSQPTTDVTYSENAQGLFLLGATRFFSSTSSMLDGEAKQPHSSGSASVEFRPHRRVRVIESWMTDRLHNATSALIESTLVNFLVDQDDGLEFSADRLVMNYNRQQAEVFVDVTRKLTLRGGHRYEWGSSEVRPASLNFVETLERGELRRHVGLAGVNYRASSRLSVNASYEGADGDKTYFRTSLQDYHRLRVRSRFRLFQSLEMTTGVHYFDNENPTEGVNYDFRSFSALGSLRWRPGGGQRFSLLTEYSWSSIKSDILFRNPGRLSQNIASSYRDLGHAVTSVADLVLPTGSATVQPRLSVGGSLFVSSGSRPTDYYQPLARFTVPLHGHVGVYAEWRWYGLSQSFYVFENFQTHHLITGLELNL